MSHEAITAARHALNRAIVARDADAIADLLAEEYHVVTALNSQRSGREDSRRAWAEMFVNDPLAAFARFPSSIEVNEQLGMAHETGRWTGTFRAAADPVNVSGAYSAKWERKGGAWLLLAEIFTPL